MLSREKGVQKGSEYFVNTPSVMAKEVFFYLLMVGHHYYEPDYFLHRDSYDSFLVMYVRKGCCSVCVDETVFSAAEGDVVCLDCYREHAYYTDEGWEALWFHFDGVLAARYMRCLTEKSGCVVSIRDRRRFERLFFELLQPFRDGMARREAEISREITGVLTELVVLAEDSNKAPGHLGVVEKSISFIQEHMASPVSLEQIADYVGLSKYYFTRLFRKETGFTPYEYMIHARIDHAKYLLKSTEATVGDISYLCGFGSESAFCNTFKKWEKRTPGEFRSSESGY